MLHVQTIWHIGEESWEHQLLGTRERYQDGVCVTRTHAVSGPEVKFANDMEAIGVRQILEPTCRRPSVTVGLYFGLRNCRDLVRLVTQRLRSKCINKRDLRMMTVGPLEIVSAMLANAAARNITLTGLDHSIPAYDPTTDSGPDRCLFLRMQDQLDVLLAMYFSGSSPLVEMLAYLQHHDAIITLITGWQPSVVVIRDRDGHLLLRRFIDLVVAVPIASLMMSVEASLSRATRKWFQCSHARDSNKHTLTVVLDSRRADRAD